MSEAGSQAEAGRPAYLRTATTPRMLLLLLVLLAVAAACARLGVWQLDRAQIKGDVQDTATGAVEPVPLVDVLAPQSSMGGDGAGRLVVAAGTFGGDQLLVPDRVLDGRTGFLVLTPLLVDAGEGADEAAVLPVVRGWVPDEAAAAALGPVPATSVLVVGHLRAGEASGRPGLPEGQVRAISPAELVNRWGGPIYSAYLVVQEVEPGQDESLLVLPPPVQGSGLDLQSLAYALQWWIFAGFAVLVWARLVRDRAQDDVVLAPPRDPPGPSPVSPGLTVARDADAGS